MQILDSQSNHMALDTVVYPQQDPLAYNLKDFYASGWGYDSVLQQNDINNDSIQQGNILNGNYYDYSSSSVMKEWDPNSSPEACTAGDGLQRSEETAAAETVSVRRKRRRTRSCKNKEELESQRMTHIAVERNRRKQMNEYLATIRSLMPPSYVQRGDQASIVGGAINFVKELEQQLQTIEAERRANIEQLAATNINNNSVCGQVFGEFFTYPQYKRSSNNNNNNNNNATSSSSSSSSCSELILGGGGMGIMKDGYGDIEVNMVESHANMKIMTKKRPKQLLKIVAALQCFYLTILHLNVTTVHHLVLYTISLKLEEGCQLTTVEEIADLVNHLLGRIEEESVFS